MTGETPESLQNALDKEPRLSPIEARFLQDYYRLRAMIPSNGWGHNPISPNDYKCFLLDLGMSDFTLFMPLRTIVLIFAMIDAEFLRIEAQKQDAKSKEKSKPKENPHL
jgi:hypothetical protein